MKILLKDAKGEQYINLIRLAFDICDQFVFIKHSQLNYNPSADTLINQLKEAFICRKVQYEWPGTFSLASAEVFYFRTTEGAKAIISNACRSMYGWIAPYLPDDLSFMKDGRPWLINTAHEHFCYIETANEEEISKIKLLKGLTDRIDDK